MHEDVATADQLVARFLPMLRLRNCGIRGLPDLHGRQMGSTRRLELALDGRRLPV
jgi:hypothetical protein